MEPGSRSELYVCMSLLAVGARLDANVTHQLPASAHMAALPPEALDRTAASPLQKYQLVAQYRSRAVRVNSDLQSFDWQETTKVPPDMFH